MNVSDMPILPRQWVTVTKRVKGRESLEDMVGYWRDVDMLAVMMPYPELTGQEPCAGEPLDLWVSDGLAAASVARKSAALCEGCPVQTACREWGIAHEEYGVWGGTTATDRERIRRDRGQVLVSPHMAHVYGLNDNYFEWRQWYIDRLNAEAREQAEAERELAG